MRLGPVAASAAPAARASSPAAEALQRAVALVQDGKLDEAAAQAQTAMADRDARPVACSVLGTIRLRQQRYDEAARLLEEAIRLEPRLLGAHLSLAEVYTLRGADRPCTAAVPPRPETRRRQRPGTAGARTG